MVRIRASWLVAIMFVPVGTVGCIHDGAGKRTFSSLGSELSVDSTGPTATPPIENAPVVAADHVSSQSDDSEHPTATAVAPAAFFQTLSDQTDPPPSPEPAPPEPDPPDPKPREPKRTELKLAEPKLKEPLSPLPKPHVLAPAVVDELPSPDSGSSALPEALQPGQIQIPLQELPSERGQVQLETEGPLVTLSVREAPLHSVLSLIAEQQGLSIVAPSGLETPITVTLQPTTLENALDAVMSVSGCTWTRVDDVIYVTSVSKDAAENFVVQGREIRVFDLNYVSATDVEEVVTGLLSPVGKVFSRQVDPDENRKTHEQLVIEDLPDYVTRVADYIQQADQPPQQVMVEARLLQVKLQHENRHGVDFDAVARLAGADVNLVTTGFTPDSGPAAILEVDGTDYFSLLDCLTSTTDSKTLAAPKLLMVNGQESKIQIGRRLGYFVTTTTQTSTLQDVQFLEVGVVLSVTPQIASDGQIVMKVHPKVSSGDINATTTLPEEETTEVETSVMVPDGHGVIIGGLIQEVDNERQLKVPWLGDAWLVGRLFQRRTVERERAEIVVALLPRIVQGGGGLTPSEACDLQRANTPIVTPTLKSAPRPEPALNDALKNPTWPPNKTSPPR